MQIVLLRDSSLPIISSQLCFPAGPCLEESLECGISHFLEHMMFKGSQNFPRGSIDTLTQNFGGSNNACTWVNGTLYSFNLPAQDWPTALKIEADRMQHLLLEPAEIEAEREVILEEWRSSDDDPEERLWEAMGKLALPEGHPYAKAILGQKEDIQRFQRQDLLAYYRRHYHPNHATLVAVGDLPPQTRQLLEDTVGRVPRGPSALAPALPPWTPQQTQQRLTLQHPEVHIPRLLLTCPAPALHHPDYAPFLLLHYALTEGWSSLLYSLLIEQGEWASDIISLLFETQHPYLFWLQAEVHENTDIEHLEQRIFEIFAQLREKGLDQDLFERAQQQLLTDFYLQRETCEDQAEFLAEMILAGYAPSMDDYVQRLKAIRPEDVQRVIDSYFQTEQFCVGYLLSSDQKSPTTPPESTPAQTTASTPEEPSADENWAPRKRAFHAPQLQAQASQLPNGLHLISHAHEKTPTLSLAFHLPAGCLYTDTDEAGLASLTLSSLIKGPHSQPEQLTQAIESKGASLSLSCGLLSAILRIETLAEHAPDILQLLHHSVTRPILDPQEINKEKALILSGLKQAQESPAWRAGHCFAQKIYQQSILAYPSDGSVDSLKSLSSEQIHRFYREHYGPKGSMLFASGPEKDLGQLQKALSIFEDWTTETSAKAQTEFHFQRQKQRDYVHIAMPEREQSTVLMGHLGIAREHEDYQALLLLDIILGSGPGFASRIPQRLREREGLAYHVSFSATHSAGQYPGFVQAQIDCAPDKILHCVRGIREEIQRVQHTAVAPIELQRAQHYVCGHFPFFFETNRQRCSYFWQRHCYQWPEDYPQRWLEQIQAVQIEDLQRAAQRHLDADAFTLITAGASPRWGADAVYAL